MARSLICSAHCGAIAPGAANPAGTIGHFVNNFTTNPSVEAGAPRCNSASERGWRTQVTATKGVNFIALNGLQTEGTLSFILYFDTLPNIDNLLFTLVPSAGNSPGLAYKASTTSLRLFWNSAPGASATEVPIVAGRLYLIDLSTNMAVNPNTLVGQVTDLSTMAVTSLGSHNGSTATTNTLSQISFGLGVANESVTGDVTYSSIVVDDTLAAYPIGAHVVEGIRPNKDGTHSLTSGNLKINNTTNITGSETDLYTNLDDDPISLVSDYINQAVVAAGDYVEFGRTTVPNDQDPRAVCLVAALRNVSGVVANAVSMKLLSAGNTDNYINGVSLLQATHIYFGKTYPQAPGGFGWTKSLFANLLVRFGFATSVGSLPALHSYLFEAEYPPAPAIPPAAIQEPGGRVSPTQRII